MVYTSGEVEVTKFLASGFQTIGRPYFRKCLNSRVSHNRRRTSCPTGLVPISDTHCTVMSENWTFPDFRYFRASLDRLYKNIFFKSKNGLY